MKTLLHDNAFTFFFFFLHQPRRLSYMNPPGHAGYAWFWVWITKKEGFSSYLNFVKFGSQISEWGFLPIFRDFSDLTPLHQISKFTKVRISNGQSKMTIWAQWPMRSPCTKIFHLGFENSKFKENPHSLEILVRNQLTKRIPGERTVYTSRREKPHQSLYFSLHRFSFVHGFMIQFPRLVSWDPSMPINMSERWKATQYPPPLFPQPT